MYKIFTLHPEALNRGLQLQPIEINGWSKFGKIAVESTKTSKGFVTEVTEEKYAELRRTLWLTLWKGSDYIFRGISYDASVTASMLSKFIYISESSAYNILQKGLCRGIFKRAKTGRQFYYTLK